MAAAPLFAFEGVTVERGPGAPILREVTTSVPDGGVTVIVGPSGAGKSTLLRLCNRLEVPTAGPVLFRGEDVAGARPAAPAPAGGDGVPAADAVRRAPCATTCAWPCPT